MHFELASPNEEDARLVMNWRNDPDTLKGSYHSAPKIFDHFNKTFREYFAFPELPPLFGRVDGKRAVFIRFSPVEDPIDHKRRCCEVSIIVAPEYRGKGLGSASLQAIKPWIKQQRYDDLYAEVKCDNIISQKAFENAEYAKLPDAIKILEDTGEKITICRYLVKLNEENLNVDKRVKIIAEAGSNWRMGTLKRDREMCKTLIDIAVEAGADVVKFQLFRPETLYVPNAGSSSYLAEAGIHDEMQSMFEDLAMPYDFVPELSSLCRDANIELMITAFSPSDFAAVEPFVTQHKIASYEIGHVHLLKLAANSGKPLLLSTGASTPEEIAWAVDAYREAGGQNLTLLQCTACYPAPPSSMHLQAIPWLKKRFGVQVGLSDHSLHPSAAPIAAVALGATVIEKHFTLNNRLPGPDNYYALTPKGLKEMILGIRNVEEMMGAPIKIVDSADKDLRSFAKRGLQAILEISKGDVLTEGVNYAILRPGNQVQGIHPKFINEVEGKKSMRKISLGEGIQHGDYI